MFLLLWLGGVAASAQSDLLAGAGAEQRSLYLERVEEPALAHNAVRTILEDRHGFLWFGTDDGLQKFDGVEFMT